jgi:hypothetical protein
MNLLLMMNGFFWDVMPRNIPEDTILHSHRHENLKSYIVFYGLETPLHE